MMQRIRWALLLSGIVVVLVFSLYNRGNVTVRVPLMEDPEVPLALLLLATSAISFVFGAIMTGWMFRGLRKSSATKSSAEPEPSASPSSSFPETT